MVKEASNSSDAEDEDEDEAMSHYWVTLSALRTAFPMLLFNY